MVERPLADKRLIGPIFKQNATEDMERTASIENGPIWTWVEVTTYNGSREDSPKVASDHVQFVDTELKRIFTSEEVKERLDFAGDLKEFDVFTEKSSDLTISAYIRHPEDFISIRLLDEVIDVIQANIDSHRKLTVRDYRVVSREYIEQQMPDDIV